jgi:hypothetical protein
VVQVPMLQPLRDVKTRWDSVYMMVRRLRALQPVSSSQLSATGQCHSGLIQYSM